MSSTSALESPPPKPPQPSATTKVRALTQTFQFLMSSSIARWGRPVISTIGDACGVLRQGVSRLTAPDPQLRRIAAPRIARCDQSNCKAKGYPSVHTLSLPPLTRGGERVDRIPPGRLSRQIVVSATRLGPADVLTPHPPRPPSEPSETSEA